MKVGVRRRTIASNISARSIVQRMVLASICALLAACGSSEKGTPTQPPPRPPVDTLAEQLFGLIQVGTAATLETFPALLPDIFAQQISGIDRQWAGYALYQPSYLENEATMDFPFQSFYNDSSIFTSYDETVYTTGTTGLHYLRQLRAEFASKSPAQPVAIGIVEVYEAFVMGTATDWFGDIPYAHADTEPVGDVPFDTQLAIYAHVRALLDTAIVNLSLGGTFTGHDRVYGGDAHSWIRLAHTLKARYHMRASRGADSIAHFQAALAEALQGISAPSGTFQMPHSAAMGSQNLDWASIGVDGDRNSDVQAPSGMIELMKARGDLQVLAADFTAVDSAGTTTYVGAPPTGYFGTGLTISNFAIAPASPKPLVTYTENQMIVAESQYRTNDPASALATLNAERANLDGPALDLAGVRILEEILNEKYVHGLYTQEPWLDYLRTCWPNLVVPDRASQPYVPARFYLGYRVAHHNPNAPTSEAAANAATPKILTSLDGQACHGQENRPGL